MRVSAKLFRFEERRSPCTLWGRNIKSIYLIIQSATLVIAYYMKKYQQAFAPAIKHVRSCRPNVCPNLGFELQLKHYQDTLNLGQTKKQSSVISKELPNDNKKQFL